MSDKKYTPGPWEVCNLTDVFTESGAANREGIEAASNDGWQIADCMVGITTNLDAEEDSLCFDEQKANANLIAAAPELLEALEQAVNAFYMEDPEWAEAMYRLIAKAKGNT